MPRSFLYEEVAATQVPETAGLFVDEEGFPLARFLRMAEAAQVMLRQNVPYDAEIYPIGSLGAVLMLGVGGALSNWFRIDNFAHDQADIVEQGTIITNVTLSWELTFDPENIVDYVLTGPGAPIPIGIDETSVTLTGVNIGTNASWTLTANTVFGAIMAITNIVFGLKNYIGRGASTAPTETDFEAMAWNALDTTFPEQMDFLENSGSDSTAYLWWAAPQSYGAPPPYRDVFSRMVVPFTSMGPINITNPQSVLRTYEMYRSAVTINGHLLVEKVT